MKLQLYGKNSEDIQSLVREMGFEIVTENPDVIVSYGGDGTLLSVEREFPGIPKLPIRDSKVCKKCSDHETSHLLQLLKDNQLESAQQAKLETEFEGNKLTALNDLVIRNSSTYHAIRFYVYKNDQKTPDRLVIGDGIVASTAFGSTGYFQSITKSTFNQNFRIAFNNIIGDEPPIEFTAGDEIKIQIIRGPGDLTSDNNPETIELVEGNQIIFRVSSQTAVIYSPETLRCPKCEIKREQRLHD